jgi:hypothetical protein
MNYPLLIIPLCRGLPAGAILISVAGTIPPQIAPSDGPTASP